MSWTADFGTIAPGETQEWYFDWSGNGDVGPQLISGRANERVRGVSNHADR